MSDYECPYCDKGYNANEHEFKEDGDVADESCKACGRSFEIICSFSVNYYTRKIKDEP